MPYRSEIDGLRALAVLPVLLFHAGVPGFAGGFVGVDVFFVISGYLITTLVLRALAEGRFSLWDFYERRARRILPAFVATIVLTAPVAVAWMQPWELEAHGRAVLAAALSVSNILFWREAGYFSAAAEEKPLLHTWSLGVEEQFYVLFPLLLLALWRRPRLLPWVFGGVALLSFGLAEVMARRDPDAAFYLLPFRAWELLAGALVALAVPRLRAGVRGEGALAGLGLALVLGPVVLLDGSAPFPSVAGLLPVAGAALVILCARPGTAVARLLSWRPLVGIGLVSYSSYLWHQPLFALARVRLDAEPSLLVMLGLCVLSLGVGALSWALVEQPFRRPGGGLLPTRRAALRVSAGALAGLALAGGAGWRTDGLLHLKTDAVQRAHLDSARPSPKRAACHTGGAGFTDPARACTYFGGTVSWAVLGDSHAVELSYGLARALEPRGIGLRHLSFSGCAPSWGRGGRTPCAAWTDRAVAGLIADPGIGTVVVSYRLHMHLARAATGGRADVEAGTQAAVAEAYRGMLAALSRAGKRVVVVLQAPELPHPMRELAMAVAASGRGVAEGFAGRNAGAAPGGSGEPGDRDAGAGGLAGGPVGGWLAGLDRAAWEARRQAAPLPAGAVPVGVAVLDPTELFCDAVTCVAASGGVSYYFDDNHLSVAGAEVVARALLAALDAAGTDGPSAALSPGR
jgi:peptidoglycan/LPS O-acetylase OafA/YrhL